MAKTRRNKTNRSPVHPFGGRSARSKVFVTNKGDLITTKGVRGRTVVNRVVNDDGKRVATVRITEVIPQIAAKPVGGRKPRPIFVGRVYTGVGRGKVYPYRSKKRGAPEVKPVGLMARAGNAMRRVVVRE
jgi:hypothetical protein